MNTERFIRVTKITIIALATLATVWAVYRTAMHVGMARMIYADFFLPRESFDPFLREIPASVRDDVLLGHEAALRFVVTPLVSVGVLWLVAFVITELQRRRER